MRGTSINPDEGISVCTVYQSGLVKIYDPVGNDGKRQLRGTQQFPHYGAAKLFATERDEQQRQARDRRARA